MSELCKCCYYTLMSLDNILTKLLSGFLFLSFVLGNLLGILNWTLLIISPQIFDKTQPYSLLISKNYLRRWEIILKSYVFCYLLFYGGFIALLIPEVDSHFWLTQDFLYTRNYLYDSLYQLIHPVMFNKRILFHYPTQRLNSEWLFN